MLAECLDFYEDRKILYFSDPYKLKIAFFRRMPLPPPFFFTFEWISKSVFFLCTDLDLYLGNKILFPISVATSPNIN